MSDAAAYTLTADQLRERELPRPVGRPAIYNPDLAMRICDRLANGEAIIDACKAEGIARNTLRKWLKTNPEFREEYAIARACFFEDMVDGIIAAADDKSADIELEEHEDGTQTMKFSKTSVPRSTLQCEQRWRVLERLFPQQYGPAPTIEAPKTGEDAKDMGRATVIENDPLYHSILAWDRAAGRK